MKRRVYRRTGFTLVEMMFAAAMLVVATMALFGGISYCARVTHDESQFLAAEAYAFDAVWMRYNEDFENFEPWEQPLAENITSNACPVLWNEKTPAVCYTIITNSADKTGFIIDVSVAWGPEGHRRILSARPGINVERDYNHPVRAFRSRFSRRLP